MPDVDAAVQWYTEVLGFRKLRQTVRVTDRSVTPNANMFKIYGERLQKVKVAYLAAANGVGIEVFEFVDPPIERPASFDYASGGVFHICLTSSDPEELCRKAVAAGAKRIGPTVMPYKHLDEDDITLYFQDPWGLAIEVMSCSFEQFMVNRPET